MAKKDWLDKVFDLHGLMGSSFPGEREEAQRKLFKLLETNRRTWNDLPELLETVRKRRAPPPQPSAPTPPTGEAVDGSDLFTGVVAVVREFLSLEEHEFVALALWAMHSHVARKAMHTPRLVLRSGLRGCGKTTCLDVLFGIVACPEKSDNMTAASFVRLANTGDATWGPTILIDEVDNLGLLTNSFFRAALNSGYRQGGAIQRTITNQVVKFRTFAPVVLAGIGTVPLPLARRAIVINLKRDPRAAVRLKKLDILDPEQVENFALIAGALAGWARDCVLASDPPMPPELTGGQCDNWRRLIAIADACGPEIAELARQVAVRMSRGLDEDLEVLLLRDIRDIFDLKQVDRLTSKIIVEYLDLLPHGLWADWRGRDNTEAPRPLTQSIMAKLLRIFEIRPTTVWPPGPRNADSKSANGYYRHQFEDAWARYCPGADTPTQTGNIIHLRPHKSDTRATRDPQ
jgi:putative DNA primase/helicase